MKTHVITTDFAADFAHAPRMTRRVFGLACSSSVIASPAAEIHTRPQPPGRNRRF